MCLCVCKTDTIATQIAKEVQRRNALLKEDLQMLSDAG